MQEEEREEVVVTLEQREKRSPSKGNVQCRWRQPSKVSGRYRMSLGSPSMTSSPLVYSPSPTMSDEDWPKPEPASTCGRKSSYWTPSQCSSS